MSILNCPNCRNPREWYPLRKEEPERFSTCGKCGARVRLFIEGASLQIELAGTVTPEQLERREKFEGDLQDILACLIDEFENATGAHVRSVDVEMLDVTNLHGPSESLLGQVHVTVDWPTVEARLTTDT